MNRRTIIKKLALGCSMAVLGGDLLAMQATASKSYKTNRNGPFLFTKVLQWVPLDDLPQVVQDLGFKGIDIAVRGNGHFQVQDLKSKLPPLVAKSTALGMETLIMTTELPGENIGQMDEILRIMAGEGVRDYRMGWFRYKTNDPMQELKAFNTYLKRLADLHEKHQVQGHYQNHAGNGVGGSVLEMLYLLEGIEPKYIGIQYDLRHAMVEGYRSWETAFHAIKHKITTLDVKDYKWRDASGTDAPVTVPLGQGNASWDKLAQTDVFKSSSIPKIVHVEHQLGGAEHGNKEPKMPASEILTAIKKDLNYFNQHLANG